MSPRQAVAALIALALVTGASGVLAHPARAEAPAVSASAAVAESVAAAPDSAAVAAPDSAAIPAYAPADAAPPVAPEPRAPARRVSVGQDLDRVEIGAGLVRGYFKVTGSLGYRRFAAERRGWQQWVLAELTGSHRKDLTEGVASFYYLFRHRATYRASSRVRPLLEGGPGLHLAVQAARLRGFSETPVHPRLFLKSHVYAGLEILLTERVGLLVRGRMTVPSRQPFDYAQAAILLR